MVKMQPGLDGLPQQPTRRVEPLGAAVDLDGDVELPARLEDQLGVEVRLGPVAAPPVTIRPVQCPSTSMCGLAIAATMRRVIEAPSIRSLEWTDATTTSSWASSSGSWSSAPVVEDVDLDPGEDPERRQLVVEAGHDLELLAQPVGDSPLATVSRGE